MKTVECWQWRYRNLETGLFCRTIFSCGVEEAAVLYPGAKRIEGTRVLREVSGKVLSPTTRSNTGHSSASA